MQTSLSSFSSSFPSVLPPVAMPADCPAAVRKAVNVLRQHAGPISGAELAQRVCASECYLSRLFHRVMGAPPARLHRRWRLEFAAELLLAGKSPCEVAADLSFADQAHFTRLFSKAFGAPPARYVRERAA